LNGFLVMARGAGDDVPVRMLQDETAAHGLADKINAAVLHKNRPLLGILLGEGMGAMQLEDLPDVITAEVLRIVNGRITKARPSPRRSFHTLIGREDNTSATSLGSERRAEDCLRDWLRGGEGRNRNHCPLSRVRQSAASVFGPT
jgi:hypothetical protein